MALFTQRSSKLVLGFFVSFFLSALACSVLNRKDDQPKEGEHCGEHDGKTRIIGQEIYECRWDYFGYTGKKTGSDWVLVHRCDDESYAPYVRSNNAGYAVTCRNEAGDFWHSSAGEVFCDIKHKDQWFEVYDHHEDRYLYFQCLDELPRGVFGEPYGIPEVDDQGRYTNYGGPFIRCEHFKKATLAEDRGSVDCLTVPSL